MNISEAKVKGTRFILKPYFYELKIRKQFSPLFERGVRCGGEGGRGGGGESLDGDAKKERISLYPI